MTDFPTFTIGPATLINGDARAVMSANDFTVDLVVTSPPCWRPRAKGDEQYPYLAQDPAFSDSEHNWLRQTVMFFNAPIWKALKPGGTLWLIGFNIIEDGVIKFRFDNLIRSMVENKGWLVRTQLTWGLEVGNLSMQGFALTKHIDTPAPLSGYAGDIDIVVDRDLPYIETPRIIPEDILDWQRYAGASVLDPFSGCGAVGVEAVKRDMTYIGIELATPSHNRAVRNIKKALNGNP